MSTSEQISTLSPSPAGQNYSKTSRSTLPPPDVRTLIEITALFVSRNGLEFEFERRIREEHRAKFCFLSKSDPFHSFYLLKLNESKNGAKPAASDYCKGPDVPEPHEYSVKFPEGITAEELDIMMLTAQFQARYGCMIRTYAKLVAAYSIVVHPPKGLKEKLSNRAADMTTVLERCFHRLQWNRFLEQRSQEVKGARRLAPIATATRPEVQSLLPVPRPSGSQFAHHQKLEPMRPKFDDASLVPNTIQPSAEMMKMPSTLVEQTRSKHEEIERLELLVMKELESEQPSSRDSLLSQGHCLRRMIKSIMLKTQRLIETYDDTVQAVEDEIAPLGFQKKVFRLFLDRLKEIHEFHREHGSGGLFVRPIDADEVYEALLKEEPIPKFTGLEGLDLHDMHMQYINSEFGQRIDYSTYLDVFSQLEKISPQLKLSSQYKKYVGDMLEYLICFFEQTRPLQDLDMILSKVEADCEGQCADGRVEGQENNTATVEKLRDLGAERLKEVLRALGLNTAGTLEQCAERLFLATKLDEDHFAMHETAEEIALAEAKVKVVCNMLDETIKRTKENEVKKQSLTFEEIEEENEGTDSEKPPLGWDGKPIPYSIYKLHDLGQEFQCEICDRSYWGRRAFERHFDQWRHQHSARMKKFNKKPSTRLQRHGLI